MKLTHNRAIFLMIAVTALWSMAGAVTRHLESARTFEVTFWRAAFTVLSLGIYLWLTQGSAVFVRMRQSGRAFWLSGVCWSVMYTAFMVALTLTSVGNVLVTMALGPLLTAVMAHFFIAHRMPLRTWIAVCAAGGGIVYMYAAQIDTLSFWGTLVALSVPVAGAVNWTVTQHAHDQGHDVDLMPAVWVGGLICCLFTLPFALPLRATPHDVTLLGALGVFQLALPCALSVRCAQALKAPEISLLQLLEVIFGILLAWWGADEAPGVAVLTGGALVIGALVANEMIGWRQRV